MISGLNHITIAVSDVSRSLTFYTELLAFKPHASWDSGAYLSCGELWFCLSLGEVSARGDYTHLAFSASADDYTKAVSRLRKAGVKCWKKNQSEGSSFYFLDPDEHKLELHDGDLRSRLISVDSEPYPGWCRLD